ncbi:MAG: heavy-metal-associated domain-containing protein [Gammaproteobacteria bacterium]|nr:heavy-metal-associated domain-containing protein [Gammaproteobacteria bacterium]
MSVVLQVEKMKCGGCVSTVKNALETLTGVTTVSVSLEEQKATISGDINIEQAESTVTALGFPAQLITE